MTIIKVSNPYFGSVIWKAQYFWSNLSFFCTQLFSWVLKKGLPYDSLLRSLKVSKCETWGHILGIASPPTYEARRDKKKKVVHNETRPSSPQKLFSPPPHHNSLSHISFLMAIFDFGLKSCVPWKKESLSLNTNFLWGTRKVRERATPPWVSTPQTPRKL